MLYNNKNITVEMQAVPLDENDIESAATPEQYRKPAFRWFTMVDTGLFILWIVSAIITWAAYGSITTPSVHPLAGPISVCLYFIPFVKIIVASVGLFQLPKWGYASTRWFIHWRRSTIAMIVITIIVVSLWVVLLVIMISSRIWELIVAIFLSVPVFSAILLICALISSIFNWLLMFETNSDEKKQVRIATLIMGVMATITTIVLVVQVNQMTVTFSHL
eukprot:TRINITY_DN14503_c0_g1_i1.p1 TRINITY_DN14503_c0_g1~~TRINITY_DN14503_c0_g1_i1.p1  ORF type:complete len:219 (+),score=23.40 TRINITY_DN14503_c0_g1_i1:280-936(+)